MGKRRVEHPLPPPKKLRTQKTISELPPEEFRKLLEQVLYHLSIDDLKNARLVNKTWSQVAVAPMREKSRDFIFRFVDRGWKLNDLHDDLSWCLEQGDFPLDKFFIHLLVLRTDESYQTRSSGLAPKPKKYEFTLDSLFQMISPFVTELSIGLEGSENYIKVENLPKKRDYPKLKYLKLFSVGWSQTVYGRRSELWKGYIDFVREIVEGAPKLENFTLEIGKGENNRAVVVQLIMDVFPNGRKINLLTKLQGTLIDNLPADYFDWTALSTMGLKLRQLELMLPRLVLSNNHLRTFLESQSKSLVNLKWRLAGDDWIKGVPVKFELPQLEKLEVLDLECDTICDFLEWNDSLILIKFPDINYQKRLPSLKNLHLDYGMQWQDFLRKGLAPLETLEELRLPRMNKEKDDTCRGAVVLAKEIFPNLKRLQIFDDPAIVTAVYQNLPHLEELTFVAIEPWQLDEFITGLKKAEGSRSERLSRLMLQKLEISKANRNSLGCLQSLHTLRLRSYEDMDGDGIVPVPGSEEFSMVKDFDFSKPSMAVLSAMDSLKRIDFFGGEKLPPPDELERDENEFLDTLKERFVLL